MGTYFIQWRTDGLKQASRVVTLEYESFAVRQGLIDWCGNDERCWVVSSDIALNDTTDFPSNHENEVIAIPTRPRVATEPTLCFLDKVTIVLEQDSQQVRNLYFFDGDTFPYIAGVLMSDAIELVQMQLVLDSTMNTVLLLPRWRARFG